MSSDDVDAARRTLLSAGADELPRAPWLHPDAPPEDVTLLRFALELSSQPRGGHDADLGSLRAALRLLDSARSDLDSLEAALLLTARAEGLTWAEIADALGLRSPQAAQQRARRISERPEILLPTESS